MQMKRKKKWIKRTKTIEQQADEEGWIYVFGPKIIRGWNSIWVEGGREGREADEGITQRPYIPSPTGCGRQEWIGRYSDSERERASGPKRAP